MKNYPNIKTLALLGCFLALSACATAAAILYPVNENAEKAKSGAYEVDPNHASVLFAVKHFGFSYFQGRFDTVTGSLDLDQEQPENSSVTADIALSSLHTGVKALDPQLLDSAMFDVGTHETANFTSTAIRRTGENTADIDGILTIKGIGKPVTLNAEFIGSGTNPLSGKKTVGFTAKGEVKRSDFELKEWLPFVEDSVQVTIDLEFVER